MSNAWASPHNERYGRLFTDGDVGGILAAVVTPERLAELHLDKLGVRYTFPAGEPTLVLKADDPGVLAAIDAYVTELRRLDVEGETLEQAERLRQSVENDLPQVLNLIASVVPGLLHHHEHSLRNLRQAARARAWRDVQDRVADVQPNPQSADGRRGVAARR